MAQVSSGTHVWPSVGGSKTPALLPGFSCRELLPAIGVAVRAIRIGQVLSRICRAAPALRTRCGAVCVIAAFGVHAVLAVRPHMMVRVGCRKARRGSGDQQGRR